MREVRGEWPDWLELTDRLQYLTLYSHAEQRGISECTTHWTSRWMGHSSRRACQLPLLSVKNGNVRLHSNTHSPTLDKWGLEKRSLVWIWNQRQESMDPNCLETTLCCLWWFDSLFLAHFWPFNTNQSWLECHGHPCASLEGLMSKAESVSRWNVSGTSFKKILWYFL